MSQNVTFLFVGSAHLDRLGKSRDPVLHGRSNPGQFIERPGGAALNVSSILQALGTASGLISQTGKDANGQAVRQCLEDRGISHQLLDDDRHPTATYTAIIEPTGELSVAMADMTICESADIDEVIEMMNSFQCRWICIDANYPAPALAQLLNQSTEARKTGLTVSTAKASRLLACLPQLDLLLTNRSEAAALAQLAVDSTLAQMGNELHILGCQSGVITDGDHSVYWYDGQENGQVNVPPVKGVVDVTGAGDALAAGVMHALENGCGLAKAVEFGVEVAASVLVVDGPYVDSKYLPELTTQDS